MNTASSGFPRAAARSPAAPSAAATAGALGASVWMKIATTASTPGRSARLSTASR